MVRWRLVPELCRWPGELAANCSQPGRGPYLQEQRRRLLWRYRLVRVLQRLGWRRPPVRLMPCVRGLAALVPLDPLTLEAARSLLQALNREALAALAECLRAQGCTARSVLPVIVSCRHRLERSQAAQQAFVQEQACSELVLRPLIVVGCERQADWSLRFDAALNLLMIPVDDAYEGLPAKVITLVALLGLLPQCPSLLKLDDDARPGNLQALVALADALHGERPVAAGYPIVTPTPFHLDRGWHLGKSRRVNDRVFDSLGARQWLSGGAGYLLNASAVRLIQAFWLHTWGFVTSMLYEDVCVSMMLQAGDADFHWLKHPADLGLASERQQEVDDGQWAIPDSFFEPT